jgi:hypothetical protein
MVNIMAFIAYRYTRITSIEVVYENAVVTYFSLMSRRSIGDTEDTLKNSV